MVQLVEHGVLDLGCGHYLRVLRLIPALGSWLSRESAGDSVPCLSLCPSSPHACLCAHAHACALVLSLDLNK